MSRIGKKPITIPAGVTVSVKDAVVTVKGPKGTLTQEVDRDIIVEVEGNEVNVKRPTEQIRHRAMHGLYRSLIANLVKGVTEGYKKIFLESADKQLIGQVAAKIRGLRKPEPYKGKGVRYSDEVVRRKAGKAAGK